MKKLLTAASTEFSVDLTLSNSTSEKILQEGADSDLDGSDYDFD